MSEYRIQEETLTNLGDKIRVLSGFTETMTPVEMGTTLDTFNTEIEAELNEQDTLIADIMTALDGKISGGGSGFATVPVNVTIESSDGTLYGFNENETLLTASTSGTYNFLNGIALLPNGNPATVTGEYSEVNIYGQKLFLFKTNNCSITVSSW